MQGFYEMYQRGHHQEVYEELLLVQGNIYESNHYADTLMVTREIMRRVHYNIEQLVIRLKQVGYLFGKGEGHWQEIPVAEREFSIFQPPTAKTPEYITTLEKLAGSLPLSLKCWYEEVGTVNFIGLFPGNEQKDGPQLDPLYIEPLESLLQIVQTFIEIGGESEIELMLAPDAYHKYGYSGGGAYSISIPNKQFDTLLMNEAHETTFINYLRLCLSAGGFAGREIHEYVSQEILLFLTKDLYSFQESSIFKTESKRME